MVFSGIQGLRGTEKKEENEANSRKEKRAGMRPPEMQPPRGECTAGLLSLPAATTCMCMRDRQGERQRKGRVLYINVAACDVHKPLMFF